MPATPSSYQQAGRIGGLTTAARARDRREITQAARDARWNKYLAMVPADIVVPPGSTLEAERSRRALALMRADMQRLSLKAATARRLKARLRRAEAEHAEIARELGDGDVPADDVA